ncbi:hypothetical protein GW17_00039588 [Ensete ventricosum]|nr:hypothetical protein GW17_00039588 [Ensete ventricosum]
MKSRKMTRLIFRELKLIPEFVQKRSVTVAFNRDHPLSSDISLAVAWLQSSREEEALREKEGEGVRRRGRKRIGRTKKPVLDPNPASPSLDDPDPGGNGEATTRAVEEAVSFIISFGTLRLLRRVLH